MNHILIIDDDVDTCTLLSAYLKSKDYEVDTSFSGNKGLRKFKEGHFDLVLCDYRLGDKEGIEVLKELKQFNPMAKVVIITGYSDIKTAIRVIKEGASDYISKPLIPEEVLNVIKDSLKNKQELYSPPTNRGSGKQEKFVSGEEKIYQKAGDEYVRGNCLLMQEVYREVGLVAPTNYSIILYGESGTGKEVIAKTIHSMSPRADKPFVTLDCGTLSKELSGSALFGHVKGAFTGAMADKAGHFEMANGGTLFLDEVFNLSYDIQASLLRALQERKLKRIGGTREIDIDIRIIVASNEDLKEAYQRGSFREDLFHRLNEFTISLPPLRERKEDIPLFVDYFMEKVKKELNRPDLELGEGLLDALIAYPWPGNIRELKNVIRRISLMATHHKIRVEDLPWPYEPVTSIPRDSESDLPNEIIEDNGETDLKYKARLAEYNAVMNVLKKINFNKSQAALILKIDRKTLYNKLQKFNEDFLHDKTDHTQKA